MHMGVDLPNPGYIRLLDRIKGISENRLAGQQPQIILYKVSPVHLQSISEIYLKVRFSFRIFLTI